MTAARDFKGDYAPAGLTTRSKRRATGRRGGLASGRKRRQLARGRRVPHARSREQALALSYRHRQLTETQFRTLYFRVRPTGYEAGYRTALEHYRSLFRCYRHAGQHYKTTNQQRGAALSSCGRPRCRRQIQRLNRLMEQMGLAHVIHFKDQRATPGHKDCLVVEIRSGSLKNVTPPTGAGTGTESLVPAVPENLKSEPGDEPTSSIPPAAPADEEPAPPESTERAEFERQLEFDELKRRLGWTIPPRRRKPDWGDHASP